MMMRLSLLSQEESVNEFQKRLLNYDNRRQIVKEMRTSLKGLDEKNRKVYLIYWPNIKEQEEELNTMTCICDSKFEKTNHYRFHIVRKGKLRKNITDDHKRYKECKCTNHYQNMPLIWNEFISYNVIKMTWQSFKTKRLRPLSVDYNTYPIPEFKKLKSSSETINSNNNEIDIKEEEEETELGDRLLYLKPFPEIGRELKDCEILSDFFNIDKKSLESKYKSKRILDKFSSDYDIERTIPPPSFNHFQSDYDSILHEFENIRMKAYNLDGIITMHKSETPYVIFTSNVYINMNDCDIDFNHVSIHSTCFDEKIGVKDFQKLEGNGIHLPGWTSSDNISMIISKDELSFRFDISKYPKNLFIVYSKGKCSINLNQVYIDIWTTSTIPLYHFIKNNVLYNSFFHTKSSSLFSTFNIKRNDPDDKIYYDDKTEYFRKLYLNDKEEQEQETFNEYGTISNYFNKNELISKVKVYRTTNSNDTNQLFYIGDQLLDKTNDTIFYRKNKIARYSIDNDNNVIIFECVY